MHFFDWSLVTFFALKSILQENWWISKKKCFEQKYACKIRQKSTLPTGRHSCCWLQKLPLKCIFLTEVLWRFSLWSRFCKRIDEFQKKNASNKNMHVKYVKKAHYLLSSAEYFNLLWSFIENQRLKYSADHGRHSCCWLQKLPLKCIFLTEVLWRFSLWSRFCKRIDEFQKKNASNKNMHVKYVKKAHYLLVDILVVDCKNCL